MEILIIMAAVLNTIGMITYNKAEEPVGASNET